MSIDNLSNSSIYHLTEGIFEPKLFLVALVESRECEAAQREIM